MERGDYEAKRLEKDLELARRVEIIQALGCVAMPVWEDDDGETIVRGED